MKRQEIFMTTKNDVSRAVMQRITGTPQEGDRSMYIVYFMYRYLKRFAAPITKGSLTGKQMTEKTKNQPIIELGG